MNDLSNVPQDPNEILSEAAMKRINNAFDEGSKARDAVLRTYRHGDPQSEIELAAANFDYAFLVMTVKQREFKAAGVRGEKLREIMREEIEGVVNSLELGDAGEKQLHDVLDHEWGW